jgi:hypothetical protein
MKQEEYLIMKNVELSLSIYSSNIKSIITIYNDSKEVRQQKLIEYEEKLKHYTRTKKEFEEYSHYKHHFDWLLIHALFISGFSYNVKLNIIKEHDIYFGPSKMMIRIKNIKFIEDFVKTSINYMNSLVNEINQKIGH